MIEASEDLNELLGTAKIYTFNKRQIMQWPAEICRRYAIDESVRFEILAEDKGFRLILKREEPTLSP